MVYPKTYMTITQAFEEVLFNSKPSECCMTGGQMRLLRHRYKNGAQIGHGTFLRLLECKGYVITVTRENSPENIKKIIGK